MRYCIDTNILFTFQKGIDLGKNPGEVMEKLYKSCKEGRVDVFIPQKIQEEISDMLQGEYQAEWQKLQSVLVMKTPAIYSHSISAKLMYEFVNDYRRRSYEGLKIAEEILVNALRNPLPSGLSKIEFEKSLQPHKETLRNRFRNATRTGAIDSTADLDLIMLSLEEDAILVSADEGVVVWGRKFGVKETDLSVFGKSINEV
ncbi:MAG: RNA ligase partner protein [Patescibacteria group bacterium]